MEKLKILVVDDKKVIGDLFNYTLGYSGHSVTFAESAEFAMDAIRKEKYDVAFIDIVIPDQDGIEILRNIKQCDEKLPIVMMSGFAVEHKKAEAQNLGSAVFLRKPFEMDDIKRAVKIATGKEI